jgi:hypothetical protein
MKSITISLAFVLELLGFIVPAAALAATSVPTISSFSPTSGAVGTLVTIKGTHFDGPGLQIAFGGTGATPETIAAKVLTVRVPPLAPTGKITVVTRYGTAVSTASFRVTLGISTFPRGAWPGQTIAIAGSGFRPFHDLTLTLDGNGIGGVATDKNGEFSTVRTLSGDITVGPKHILVALDAITHAQPKFHLWIFGNWPQARFDPADTGNGAAEFTINTSNVSKVKTAYGLGSTSSPIVEDNGSIFYGYDGTEFNLERRDPFTGPYGQGLAVSGAVTSAITQAAAVANGVVYAVANDSLYAFAETNLDRLWTARLGNGAAPYAPVVADGRVYVANSGTGTVMAFDATGVTNCDPNLHTCLPVWSSIYTKVFGAPAVDAKSAGGTGNVFFSAQNNGNNKVFVRNGATGATIGASAALASSSLSAPALSGGRVFVSGWSSGSATATLNAVDASTFALSWSSSDLGGTAQPTAAAVGSGKVFVQNSNGTLRAFKAVGCGTGVCDPQWSSASYSPGGTTPPTIANGVVYAAAGAMIGPQTNIISVNAFDATGCGSAVCSAIASPGASGFNSQITVVAATIFTQGDDTLWVSHP